MGSTGMTYSKGVPQPDDQGTDLSTRLRICRDYLTIAEAQATRYAEEAASLRKERDAAQEQRDAYAREHEMHIADMEALLSHQRKVNEVLVRAGARPGAHIWDSARQIVDERDLARDATRTAEKRAMKAEYDLFEMRSKLRDLLTTK